MSYNFSYENIGEYCATMWGFFLNSSPPASRSFFCEWGIIILYSNEKKGKKNLRLRRHQVELWLKIDSFT